MSEQIEVVLDKKPRLKFIDMARSIAILLMLEGHFIGLSLGQEFRDPSNIIYSSWNFIRGFTAPMFFTVTGLIFVYLLSAKMDAGFLSNQRVRKGFKRSSELLFWGFALQLNFTEYFKGNFGSWLFAIHVLQCIGIGIACLLLIFGLHRITRFFALHWYYLIFGSIIFFFYPHFKGLEIANLTANEPHYIPANAPGLIQNLFLGENSVFPIVPWVIFTLFGGMIGSLIRTYERFVVTYWFPLIFIGFGLACNMFGYAWFQRLDWVFQSLGLYDEAYLVVNNVLLCRFGQVIIVLGILMFIDKHSEIRDGLFLKIGQHTLPVYVVHVIILYGGITGFGLHKYIKEALSPEIAILGAVLFISSFIVMVKYLEPLEEGYNKVRSFINPFKNKK